MIGPGWMPSRPRPLTRARRGLLSYTAYPWRRPVRRRPPSRDGHRDAAFEAAPAELPVATLRPNRSQALPRRIAGQLQRWAAHQWIWLRPRSVPLVVAFAGMLALLGAIRYLSSIAHANWSTEISVDKPCRGAGHAPPAGPGHRGLEP